ncbi:MAG: glycosyltransferase family 2 protein [Candidatus Latescibacteria bacterium]|nr:glycosyltransferase family 2 protein [Candidatus Latescibacterota bacterium]
MDSAIPVRVPVPPSVVVVVLTWNGRELTMDCLRSLEAVATPNVRVMVVDNASMDGTVAAIRARYGARVEVVENPTNLGYAGGNNAGIRRALDDGARFILLLNNDTTVAPDFVDELLNAMHEPMIGIAAPKIYFAEPRDRVWYAGGEISLWRGVARHAGIRQVDRGQFDHPHDVDYASGCALFARREVFERVGLLDEAYRAYFEDADLCMRAARAGFRIRYVPGAKVWHRISASTGGQVSRAKVRRKLESSWRFFRAHARPYHWLTIPLFFALDVVRITGLVLVGRIRDADPL